MVTRPEERSDGSSPASNWLNAVRYLGFAFFAIFLITFLVAVFLIRGAIRDARGVLSEDLETTVRQYNNPTSAQAPRVGVPYRENRPTLELED